MDYRKLKIGDVLTVNGNVAFTTTFIEEEAKYSAVEKSRGYFEEEFSNKRLLITGDDYTVVTKILDVECTSNIIEFKNIHLLTELTEIGDIKENDLVMILD